MSSTLVIYSSKYVASKQYATWIAQELGADLKEIHEVGSHELIYYETVIFGSSLYMGKLRDYKKLLNLLIPYPPETLILFAVGLMKPSDQVTQEIKNRNHIEDDTLFYFRGQMDYKKLTFIDKLLMQGLKQQIKKSPKNISEYQEILNVFETPLDFVDKEVIHPLVQLAYIETDMYFIFL